jgi:hypothetical protein
MAAHRTFDDWASAVSHELTKLGIDMLEAKHVPYDNEDWFRREFDAGESPSLTAADWHATQ